jgi:hypothetical protein
MSKAKSLCSGTTAGLPASLHAARNLRELDIEKFRFDVSRLDGVNSMTNDSQPRPSFAATVDWLYAGLIQFTKTHPGSGLEPGLGGSLLYAGELEGAGSELVVAGNIAGAASLVASADPARQRQAIRDGVIDFLVTSLDEALRIFKNEIRKQETVAVCVTEPPKVVEREMVELGVLPDLLPPGVLDAPAYKVFLDQGARQVNPISAVGDHKVLTWKVTADHARWLPRLDSIARDCIGVSPSDETWSALRWLRLAPRYLGRMANGVRLLRCDSGVATGFLSEVREQVAKGAISVPVEVHLSSGSHSELHLLSPINGQTTEEDFDLSEQRPFQSGPTIQ